MSASRRFPGKARGARLSRPLRARRRRAGLARRAPAAGDDPLRRTGFPVPPQRELALSRPAAARTNAAAAGRARLRAPDVAGAARASWRARACRARLPVSCWSMAASRPSCPRLPPRPGCGSARWRRRCASGRTSPRPLVAAISGEAAQPFAALNAAFFADGYVLVVAPGVALDGRSRSSISRRARAKPRSIPAAWSSLGDGSRASVVETYAGEGRVLAQRRRRGAARRRRGADPHRAGRGGAGGAASRRSSMRRSAPRRGFAGFALLLGGRRVRHEANVRIAGEGARCRLDGAFLVGGSDEANIVTTVDHAAPRRRRPAN